MIYIKIINILKKKSKEGLLLSRNTINYAISMQNSGSIITRTPIMTSNKDACTEKALIHYSMATQLIPHPV